MQIRFTSAEIDIIIHATEDHLKMLNTIEDMLRIEKDRFLINRLEGHHGNEIILMKARLNGREATELAYNIIDSLNIYERRRLVDDLDHHIERNSLYIRISKQELFKKRITFGDDIKIRFKVKGFKPKLEFDEFKKVLRKEYG